MKEFAACEPYIYHKALWRLKKGELLRPGEMVGGVVTQ